MLTIRKAQWAALSRARVEDFELRLVHALKTKYAERCASMGDGAVQESVRTAMAKREEHQFETEECIVLYLDLMYRLGFDFDVLPWVQDIVRDHEIGARTRFVSLLEQADAQ